jgi:hypothetical protein
MSEIINLKLLLLLFSFTDSFVFLYLVLISIKKDGSADPLQYISMPEH